MTDREIQQACLDAYTDALENLPSDYQLAYDFLIERNLEEGVCLYLGESLSPLGIKIKWIKPYIKKVGAYSNYWYRPPIECNTIEEIKESLQFRINKLKEILNG